MVAIGEAVSRGGVRQFGQLVEEAAEGLPLSFPQKALADIVLLLLTHKVRDKFGRGAVTSGGELVLDVATGFIG
jgi:hypothetical protein